ncbi:fimbrial protein [Paraburkholderia sp. J12]|uniref:fimbrial protein n=1 Tax=Paraburkholderia sp. J12 TaxID=2805432 RepID=UPI002ABE7B0F|nr:fimbrial protein [Paraburkholderia sp. J12]
MNSKVECLWIACVMFCFAAAALFAPVGASAQSSPTVTIHFTGTYIADTCTVVSSPDMTVTLPTISTQSLTTAGMTAGATVFTVSMQCDSDVTGALVYFESGSTTDPATGYLVPQAVGGTTSATNVEVMLENGDGSPIKVGDRNTMKVIPVTSTGPTPANFIAKYYATGRTTPGMVNTYVTYVIQMP